MIAIGIDSGLDGAVVAIRDGQVIESWVVPTIERMTTKKQSHRREYDLREIWKRMQRLANSSSFPSIRSEGIRGGERVVAALEVAHASPRQRKTGQYDPEADRPTMGAMSAERIGIGLGMWEAFLVASEMIVYEKVSPQKWHNAICGKSANPKAAAIAIVQRRLPNLNLRRTERCTTPHTGLADAACIALYAEMVFK